MARSSFGPSKDGTNCSVPPILVVPNKGLLFLGAVLIAGGFDAVFERSVAGERGVLLLVWDYSLRRPSFLNAPSKRRL